MNSNLIDIQNGVNVRYCSKKSSKKTQTTSHPSWTQPNSAKWLWKPQPNWNNSQISILPSQITRLQAKWASSASVASAIGFIRSLAPNLHLLPRKLSIEKLAVVGLIKITQIRELIRRGDGRCGCTRVRVTVSCHWIISRGVVSIWLNLKVQLPMGPGQGHMWDRDPLEQPLLMVKVKMTKLQMRSSTTFRIKRRQLPQRMEPNLCVLPMARWSKTKIYLRHSFQMWDSTQI